MLRLESTLKSPPPEPGDCPGEGPMNAFATGIGNKELVIIRNKAIIIKIGKKSFLKLILFIILNKRFLTI
jgi:hypothetical protein